MMQPPSPEQQRAITYFENSGANTLLPVHITSLTYEQLTITGFSALVEGPVTRKHLPMVYDQHWAWHQSCRKFKVNTLLGIIELNKMCAKRTVGGPKAPFLKVWVFKILEAPTAKQISFLWCEKGNRRKELASPMIEIKKSAPHPKLSDLSFLAEFLDDPSLAAQFGWTEPKTKSRNIFHSKKPLIPHHPSQRTPEET